MKSSSTNDQIFLLFVTMGLICGVSGVAAALESKFALAGVYLVMGPLLVIGAHLLWPKVEFTREVSVEEIDELVERFRQEDLRQAE